MNFTSLIIEAHNNNISIKNHKDGLGYIAFDKYLYQLKDSQLILVTSTERSASFCFNELGLWICELNGDSDDKKISTFDDYYNLGLNLKSLPIWVSEVTYVIDKHIYGIRDSEWPKNYLYRINLYNGNEKKIEGIYVYLSHNLECTYLFVREKNTGLICYDLELNELWSQPIEGISYSIASQYPQFHDDLVIINHSSDIFSYKQGSGEPCWSYHFEISPGSFTVLNGMVYCESDTDIVVLDALTGGELIREPTGYPKKQEDVISDQSIGVYPVGEDCIFTSCSYASEVKLFSADGKRCLQSLDIWHNSSYSVQARNKPTIINGTIFQSVTNSQVYSANGLLVLKPDQNNDQPSIKTQQRLPTQYYAVPSLMEDHKYQIYIEGNQVDLIRRFAGIAIKELHFETGCIPEYNLKKGALDYRHNGIIELIVDLSILEKNASNVLLDLINELDVYFKKQNALTSNKKHEIKIQLIDKPKDEWKYEGELLDLKLVTEQGKELNSK